MTLGISLIIKSQLGASPWDAANAGLAQVTSLSMGTWVTLTGIMLVVLIAIITQKKINYIAILAGILTGILIDIWNLILNVVITSDAIVVLLILGIIGIFLFPLGIAMYTATNLAPNPIDNFMMELVNEKNIAIGKAKFITDAIGLTIAIIVGGPIGIGTLILYMSVPLLITYFDQKLKKL